MDDNSFSIYHEDYQRVTRNFLNPQHIIYPNNSFHTYDQFLSNDNTYKEQTSVSTTDLSPSKESINRNIYQTYDCKINWVQPISRRRRQRTVFSQNNIQQLDSVFIYNQYPDIELRETLAAQMGVSESRIQVWFKNRRTRARTAQRRQLKILES